MKYLVCAGEASGDLHAAELIAELRKRDSDARFAIIGGPLMAKAAGVAPIRDYRETAVMGFVEVARNAGRLLRHLEDARKVMTKFRPDVFVPVDYPGFNLRLAAEARKLGIPTAYYISPKLWAWKKWRGRAIRRDVDRMLCIFPFEPEYYVREHRYGRADYVGNPSVEEMRRRMEELPDAATLMAQLPREYGDSPLLALVPGSRKAEITDNLPVMVAAAATQPSLRPVIAGAPGIDTELYSSVAPGVPVVYDLTSALMRHAETALVTSGTATLECALIGTPQVVLYRSNGMRIAYEVMKRVISVNYVSLPNLVAGREVVPELLVHQCTPERVAQALARIMPGTPGAEAQRRGYAEIALRLGPEGAAARAAQAVIDTARAAKHP